MFHEAREWKWVQAFHALMVITAVHAVAQSFKNNLWLITLWPHRYSARSPVRPLQRYSGIPLAGLQSDNLCGFFCCFDLFCFVSWVPWFELLKMALVVSAGSNAVNLSLWGGTKECEQPIWGKGQQTCGHFVFISLLSKILHFTGEEGERKLASLAMINILCVLHY